MIAFSGRALGSPIGLHVRQPVFADASTAELAWDAVRAELDAVDVALSRFRADSELTALNRQAGGGATCVVSWRLRTALAAVHRAGRITDGRFDARVLEVLERIGEHGAPLDGAEAGPGPGSPGVAPIVATDRPPSRVIVPDAPIDLGGIGKGLALRWAAAAAMRTLPGGAGLLLEAGGDVVVAGAPPDAGWLVGVDDPVADPDGEARPVAVLALATGAVATSSIAVRNWVAPDGRPVHHLVDPATSEPARTGLISVTVAAPDPAWAEVWTKALFLAGRAEIGNEARRRGLAAWWIDDRGCLGMTPAARQASVWVAEARLG